jgi:tripeptide aminopeptidase
LGADDKSGLAAAIECVRRLAEKGGARPNVRCVFTVQEEVGLKGAKALEREVVEADLCLVLDADGEPGGVVIGAPTHYTFTATFTGRAAHAGVAPEKGVSAIAMAADAISSIEIGRLDEQTTANIGTISGGIATNVVAAKVIVTGECRSRDRDRVEAVRQAMDSEMREAASKRGGSVEVEWALEYESFSIAEDDPLMSIVLGAAVDAGLSPHTFMTGGGSDANVIAALGVPTVALACGMKGVHGTEEQIATVDLESLTRLCEATARRLAEEGES